MSIFKYKAVFQKQRRTWGGNGCRFLPEVAVFPFASEPSMGNTLTHSHQHTAEPISATTGAGSLCRLWLLMQHTNSGMSVWRGAQGSASQMLESLHSQTLRALYKDLNFPSAKPLLGSKYWSPILIFGKRFILSPTWPHEAISFLPNGSRPTGVHIPSPPSGGGCFWYFCKSLKSSAP